MHHVTHTPLLRAAATLANAAPVKKGRPRKALPPLFFLTDRRRIKDAAAIVATLPPGTGVILRDYDAPDRPDLARRLAALAKARRLVFLVGADPALAAAVRADGVHWPEGLLPPKAHNRLNWIVTAAAHGAKGLTAAARSGADAAFLSPVFATDSHPGAARLEAVRFAALAHNAAAPVYALGGVGLENWRRLKGAGAAGFGAIGAFASSK